MEPAWLPSLLYNIYYDHLAGVYQSHNYDTKLDVKYVLNFQSLEIFLKEVSSKQEFSENVE